MKTALNIQNLQKTYASGTQALKGISIQIKTGDFFALLGANGAGKSTILGILTDTITKTSGHVSVFGHDIDSAFPLAKQHIGIMPQEFNFDGYQTLERTLSNQAGFFGMPSKEAEQQTEKWLKKVNLWEKRDQPANSLSGGMKRRLMLARALVNNPDILIVDEPTAGVDVELRHEIWELLKELNTGGMTVLLTTHYLEEVEYLCRNMAMIHEGKIIAEDSVKNLLQQMPDRVYTLEFATSPTQEQIKQLNLVDVQENQAHVSIPEKKPITDFVSDMHQAGVIVRDMRPKMNRMEQFFLRKLNELSA